MEYAYSVSKDGQPWVEVWTAALTPFGYHLWIYLRTEANHKGIVEAGNEVFRTANLFEEAVRSGNRQGDIEALWDQWKSAEEVLKQFPEEQVVGSYFTAKEAIVEHLVERHGDGVRTEARKFLGLGH